MVSFGHAAFIGIGAYAVGILAAHGIGDFLVQALAAIALSGLFALITGAISLRTKGVYFIMITLAFGQMVFFLAVSLSAYGGDDGLTLARRAPSLGWRLFDSDLAFYLRRVRSAARPASSWCAPSSPRVSAGVLRGIARKSRRGWRAIGFSPFRYQLAAYCHRRA